MAMIIRLQNLSWNAQAADVRRFFSGLFIPEGGVHIVGGEFGDAFITFGTEDDARLALRLNGQQLCGEIVKLFVSSTSEMQQVVARAKQAAAAAAAVAAAPPPSQAAVLPSNLSNRPQPAQQLGSQPRMPPPPHQSQQQPHQPPPQLSMGGYPPEKRRREAIDATYDYAEYDHAMSSAGAAAADSYQRKNAGGHFQSNFGRNGGNAYNLSQRYHQHQSDVPMSNDGGGRSARFPPARDGRAVPYGGDQVSPSSGDRFPPGSRDQIPPGGSDRFPPGSRDRFSHSIGDQHPPASGGQFPPGRQIQHDGPSQGNNHAFMADNRDRWERHPDHSKQQPPINRDEPSNYQGATNLESFQQSPAFQNERNPQDFRGTFSAQNEKVYAESDGWPYSSNKQRSFGGDDLSHQSLEPEIRGRSRGRGRGLGRGQSSNSERGFDPRSQQQPPTSLGRDGPSSLLQRRGGQTRFTEGRGGLTGSAIGPESRVEFVQQSGRSDVFEGQAGRSDFTEGRGGLSGFNEGRGGRIGFNEGRGGRSDFIEGRGGLSGFNEGRGGRTGFNEGRGGRSDFTEGRGGRTGFNNEGRGGQTGFNEGRGSRSDFIEGQGGLSGFNEGRGGRSGFNEGRGGRSDFIEGRGGRSDFIEGREGRTGFNNEGRGPPCFNEGQRSPGLNEGRGPPDFTAGRGGRSGFKEGRGGRSDYTEGRGGRSDFFEGQGQTGVNEGRESYPGYSEGQCRPGLIEIQGGGSGLLEERRAGKFLGEPGDQLKFPDRSGVRSTSLLGRPDSQPLAYGVRSGQNPEEWSGQYLHARGQNPDVAASQYPDEQDQPSVVHNDKVLGGQSGIPERRGGRSRFSDEGKAFRPDLDFSGQQKGFEGNIIQTEPTFAGRGSQFGQFLPIGQPIGLASAGPGGNQPGPSAPSFQGRGVSPHTALSMHPKSSLPGPPQHSMRAPAPPRPQAAILSPNIRSPTPKPMMALASERVTQPSANSQPVASRGRGIGFRRSRFDNNTNDDIRASEETEIPAAPLSQQPGSGRGIGFALARNRMTAIGAGIRPPEQMLPRPQMPHQQQTLAMSGQNADDSATTMIRNIRNSSDSTPSSAPTEPVGLFRPRPWEVAAADTNRLAPHLVSPEQKPEPKTIQPAPQERSDHTPIVQNPVASASPSRRRNQSPARQEQMKTTVPVSKTEAPAVDSSSVSAPIKYERGQNDAHYLALRDVPLDARYNDVVGALPAGVRLSHSAIKYEADALRRRTGQVFIRLTDIADQRRCLASPKTLASRIHVRQSCEHEFISANDPTLSESKLVAEAGGPLPSYPKCPSPYHDDCCLEISGLPKPILRDDLVSIFGQSVITDPVNDIFIDQSKCPFTATAYVHFSLYSGFQNALSTDASKHFPGASVCAISMIQFREYANISRKAAVASLSDINLDFRLTRDQRLAAASGAATVAKSDSEPDESKQVCVEVQNLPLDVTTQELRDFFNPFIIERDAIQLIVHGSSLQAFAQFVDSKVASDAVAKNDRRRLRGAVLALRLRSLGQRREALAALGIAAANTTVQAAGKKRSSSSSSSKSKKQSRRRSRSRREGRR